METSLIVGGAGAVCTKTLICGERTSLCRPPSFGRYYPDGLGLSHRSRSLCCMRARLDHPADSSRNARSFHIANDRTPAETPAYR